VDFGVELALIGSESWHVALNQNKLTEPSYYPYYCGSSIIFEKENMIRLNLEVLDPTRSDAPQLLALAALFTSLAAGNKADQTRATLERTAGASPAMAAPYAGQLDPADNPGAGMPSPVEAFGTSMGNGVAGSGSVSSPSHASTGAASADATNGGHSAPAASLPDPAVAFGGSTGNAAAVPPPMSGPQASSAATPQTSAPGAPVPPPASPPVATPAPTPGTVSAPAASTGTVPGVELDAEGIPWDASIHASTKVKIANGTWKVKRGTGEAYLLERKALLKAAVSVGNAAPAGAPATPSANASAPPPPGAGAPGNAPAPAAGATTTTQSPATTPNTAGSSPVTLAQVMPRVTAAISSGTLTVDSAAAIVLELSEGKINNVAMLAVAPALLPAFVARLDALGIPA
jgi:hypothetical protein